jgi:aspartyl-tRNA(Asn)/glutamyl-tRNA(Gln) amidotransferase subunit A
VVGLKPTYGTVSRHGVFPLAFTLDHVGPMARSAGDAALLLDVVAGHDPLDPGSVVAAPREYSADLARGLRGLRVGFVRHFHERDVEADPEVTRAIAEVARVMEGEGAQVREVELPPLQEFYGAQRIIMAAESWAVHARWLRTRPGDYCASSRRRLMAGAFLSAGDYIEAQQRRHELIAAVTQASREVDILLVANSMDPPCRIDDADAIARTYTRQARNVFSLTGQPAIALMCGLSSQGLPLSVQLAARPHDEAMLLRAGSAYERATRWHLRHPLLQTDAS